MTKKLFPRNDTNLPVMVIDDHNRLDYKVLWNQLLLLLMTITGHPTPKRLKELCSEVTITKFFSNPDLLPTYYYFLMERAATRRLVEIELEIPYTKVKRYVNFLEKYGFIVKALKASECSKQGGPKSVVYAVPDFNLDDLHKVLRKEKKRTSPHFQLSERIAQLILDEYLEPRESKTISRGEVIDYTKDHPGSGYYLSDLVHEICRILVMKGIRVIM